jgi:hypothetical protein
MEAFFDGEDVVHPARAKRVIAKVAVNKIFTIVFTRETLRGRQGKSSCLFPDGWNDM